MKSLSPLLSGILYTGIVIVAIIIVMNVIIPFTEKMKDKAAFESAKETMLTLDKAIQSVLKEGRYSSRVVPVEIKRGKLVIDNTTGKIWYELETEAEIISTGTKKEIGNLILASGADVSVKENNGIITMRNSYIEANFTKIGNESYFVPVNLSEIITGIRLIRENVTIHPQILIKIADIETGEGYVKPAETGDMLPSGTVIAHVVSGSLKFDLYFTLRSYADFLTVEAKNIEVG